VDFGNHVEPVVAVPFAEEEVRRPDTNLVRIELEFHFRQPVLFGPVTELADLLFSAKGLSLERQLQDSEVGQLGLHLGRGQRFELTHIVDDLFLKDLLSFRIQLRHDTLLIKKI
jgi:hypothetical protein